MLRFLGTCSSKEISRLAERYGRSSSYKNACRQIKKDYPDMYDKLGLDFFNPWANKTNIKRIGNNRILHIVNSDIDYLFIIE